MQQPDPPDTRSVVGGRPQRAQPPAFSSPEFRAALGMFATGVTIVTTRAADGTPVGMTVNSFNSVSLAPPLVLWSLSRTASARTAFASCSHYAVNVLGVGQQGLAERFASGCQAAGRACCTATVPAVRP